MQLKPEMERLATMPGFGVLKQPAAPPPLSMADIAAVVGRLPADPGRMMDLSAAFRAAPKLPFPAGDPSDAPPPRPAPMSPLEAAAMATPRGRGGWLDILGALSDGVLAGTGRNPVYLPAMQHRSDQDRVARQNLFELAERERQHQAENEIARDRLRQPQFANVPGVGYVAVNPEDLTSQVVQASRSPADVYADSLGLEPGTPERETALRDFTLRGSGPTAYGQRQALQEDQQAAALERMQRSLAVQREIARARERTARDDPRRVAPDRTPNSEQELYADIMRRHLAGEPTSPADRSFVHAYELRHGGQPRRAGRTPGRSGGNGAIIRNPRTGQRMQLQGGRWVPIQ